MNTDKGYRIIFDEEKTRMKYKHSLIKQTNTVLGICEQLRFIYDVVYEFEDGPIKEQLTDMLVDAFIMVKKMDKRLFYYKKRFDDGTGHNASHLIRLQGNSSRVRGRRARVI